MTWRCKSLEAEAPLGNLAVGGLGAGPAATGLAVLVLLAHGAFDHQVAHDVMALQDGGDLQVDLGGAPQPCLGTGQAQAKVLEFLGTAAISVCGGRHSHHPQDPCGFRGGGLR